MWNSFRNVVLSAAAVVSLTGVAGHALADGRIDPATIVSAPQGTYNGVAYTRYEAMFQGVTANRPYRVPCQIISPTNHAQGSGLLLFDWLVHSTILTAVGQEQADARYTLTDGFLFGRGVSYATVRCNPQGLGKRSPVPDPTRPWSDGLLDTSGEFITSPGDEFDIVADYVRALKSDPTAAGLLAHVERTAAFAYSASGYRLRGLLRIPAGRNLFAFSLVGGTGDGHDQPNGNRINFSSAEKAPNPGAGLEIDFQSETDSLVLGAYKTRHEESNYRCYQFAGASHIRDIEAFEFGLADPASANTADWIPFFRAMFVAANNWCDGVQPPPTLWLGAPNDPSIARDAKGNAIVRYVGGRPTPTLAYRLPEVAVGQNQYIAVAPSFLDGTFLRFFRSLAGSHVDLTGTFTDHAAYVADVTTHARRLQAQGYLLEADADAIIQRAAASNIGL